MSVQIAWYGHDIDTDAEGGPITGIDKSSSADGTPLLDAVNNSDLSSDDELFGLLEKSVADGKATNGNYSLSGDVSHGVQQYTGNTSTMLSGINTSQSTVVQ